MVEAQQVNTVADAAAHDGDDGHHPGNAMAVHEESRGSSSSDLDDEIPAAQEFCLQIILDLCTAAGVCVCTLRMPRQDDRGLAELSSPGPEALRVHVCHVRARMWLILMSCCRIIWMSRMPVAPTPFQIVA